MFRNVVIGINGHQGGSDAIALATQLASPGSELTLAHFYGEGYLPLGAGPLSVSAATTESRLLLESERETAGLEARLCGLPDRSVGHGLHALALRLGADLIVVGSRHRGRLGRVLIGDPMSAALNGSPCAIAIAPSGYAPAPPLRRIGVGYDESLESVRALEAAIEIAAEQDACVTAMSVISLESIPYGEPIGPNLSRAVARVFEREERLARALSDFDADITYGTPSTELERFSRRVDLLAIGSRGQGPFGRLVNGSSSTHLARHSTCPLLVLPRTRRPVPASVSAQTEAATTEAPAAMPRVRA